MTHAISASASAEEQPVAEVAPAPVAKFIGDLPRDKIVPLEWPIEFDGKLYEAIRIRRVSAKEVRDYLEALRTSEADIMPPMIDCPLEVWSALDADDHDAVDQAAMEFTPKRLKAIFDAVVTLDAAGTATT